MFFSFQQFKYFSNELELEQFYSSSSSSSSSEKTFFRVQVQVRVRQNDRVLSSSSSSSSSSSQPCYRSKKFIVLSTVYPIQMYLVNESVTEQNFYQQCQLQLMQNYLSSYHLWRQRLQFFLPVLQSHMSSNQVMTPDTAAQNL